MTPYERLVLTDLEKLLRDDPTNAKKLLPGQQGYSSACKYGLLMLQELLGPPRPTKKKSK